MHKNAQQSDKTRELLINHYQTYPKLKPQDIFKFIFQSSFGCEHLVSSESRALEYIEKEYKTLPNMSLPRIEKLDGEYSRVCLSCLNDGLKPHTLARLFCLSSKNESDGKVMLEQKLEVARELVREGRLPFDVEDFEKELDLWRSSGCKAIHHSSAFRSEYQPAYRVLADRYADFLPLFEEIDKLSSRDSVIVAIEGGSASGKTTLSDSLRQVYDCNVFHVDDFFLRPEQRTPERFAQIGGNVDRERFAAEVLDSLKKGETVQYRCFDCHTQSLGELITVEPKTLTIVEGVYSTHPAFSRYFDIAVFLDITPECQRNRILKRNAPRLAERFFDEWIPLENRYFSGTDIKKRADLIFCIG